MNEFNKRVFKRKVTFFMIKINLESPSIPEIESDAEGHK